MTLAFHLFVPFPVLALYIYLILPVRARTAATIKQATRIAKRAHEMTKGTARRVPTMRSYHCFRYFLGAADSTPKGPLEAVLSSMSV